MLKIAISGSTGLVGSRVVELLKDDFEFIPLLQDAVDITSKDQVSAFIQNTEFDIFLHLAAYTKVNRAEEERDLAYKINATGTSNLFEAVQRKKKKFIYISTDYAFNLKSKDDVAYEESQPNPVGAYGSSKYEGEKVVRGYGMIVRLSYPYRASFKPKEDFVRKIKSLLEGGASLTMIHDSTMTPTFIDDFAKALAHLLQNFTAEVFHLVGADSMSPFDTGLHIAQVFKLDRDLITPVSFSDYYKDLAEKRPQYTAIGSRKNNFHKMRTLEEGLWEIAKQLK
ncbi:NAD(P)-dependent oxidoreductase [Candidatus Roizmanbacteria bacterium]|nr:NAD(P)-dependent oxidoreductase [Candidatus Roizmanbacteria bacterium]